MEGKQLSVHLWDVTTTPATFLKCTCPPLPRCPQRRPSLFGSDAEIARVYVELCGQTHGHSKPLPKGLPSPNPVPMPSYGSNEKPTNEKPVNVTHGAVLTEARGVFVSNLNFTVNSSDLTATMRTAGNVVQCKLFRDSRTGRSKGTGTVLFSRAFEARAAVSMLNNTEFMGLRIRVRLDKEQTTVAEASTYVSQAQPVIVDGSTPVRTRSRFLWEHACDARYQHALIDGSR